MTVSKVTEEVVAHALCKPVRPRFRRLLLVDVSKRAVVDRLEGDSESAAIFTDEGTSTNAVLFEELGFLNKLWDGGTLVLDRANSVHMAARNPRVTVSMMVQHDAFQKFFGSMDAVRSSGFLARFLMSRPPSCKGSRFIDRIEPLPMPGLAAFHRRISTLIADGSANMQEEVPCA